MKNVIIVGVGEVGSAIEKLERENENHLILFDDKLEAPQNIPKEIDVMHISIPFIKNFVNTVIEYIDTYKPKITIINSTVKPGITDYIKGFVKTPVVHSPIRGIHPNLYEGIKTFVKFIGGEPEDCKLAQEHFESFGIKTSTMTSKESEFLKLLDTTYYGWNIAYANYVKEICDENELDYNNVYTKANVSYDEGYTELGKSNVVRPVLFPPEKGVGGHCLDGEEFIYTLIKKNNMKGIKIMTIKEYHENKMTTPVLSFDFEKNISTFTNVLKSKCRLIKNNKMNTIKTHYGRKVKITDKHVMITKNNNKYKEKIGENIKIGDNIPIITNLPKITNMTIDKDMCRLIGYYLAEGCVTNYKHRKRNCSMIRFSFHKNETEYINDVSNIIRNKNMKSYLYTQKNVTHVCCKNTEFSKYIRDTLECKTYSDKEIPSFIFLYSKDYKIELLKGYFRGDGYINDKIISAYSTSKKLMEGIDLLLLSLKIPLSKEYRKPMIWSIENRTGISSPGYSLRSGKSTYYNKLLKYFKDDRVMNVKSRNTKKIVELKNHIGIGVIENKEKYVTQKVYSLETENELFVTSGGIIVHNCVTSNAIILNEFSPKLCNEILKLGKNSKDSLNDKDWLYCEYVTKNTPISKIAKELNVSKQIITNKLIKYNIYRQ